MSRGRRPASPLVVALLCLAAVGAPGPGGWAAAQEAAEAGGSAVSPFVPAGHWSIDAARRLHGLGLMPPGYDPGVSAQTVGGLRSAFAAAAGRSALARAYHDRLVEELGDAAAAGPAVRGWLEAGYRHEDGRLYTGTGYTNDRPWMPPTARDPVSSPVVRARVLGSAGPVAWSVAPEVRGDGAALPEGYLMAGWRGVGLWAGVRTLGFGTAPGTGIVLESLVPRPGFGVHLLEPVTLPWLLRHLGPVQATTTFVRARRNHEFEHPWVWATRVAFEPHPRLRLGVNRAIMMGGEGNDELSLRHVAYLLIGKHTGAYDNQLVSATFRYRPPVGGLPVVTYLEWGLEDSAGAWKNVPGMLAGVELATLPFASAASAGVAATWFRPSCCGNPIWYRNWSFQGGWADDGRLLGHALGGHGEEWRGYGRVDLLEARAQLRLDGFLRNRRHENVYAPTREGRSVGGGLGAEVLLGPGWRVVLDARGESAMSGDWREAVLDVGIRGAI